MTNRKSVLLRQVPLILVWLLAVWPVLLWGLHRHDPELAVRTAQVAAQILWQGGIGALVLLLAVCLVYPPAPAWLRLAGSRTLRTLTSDRAPMRRALAELRHFESASRHLEVGRLAAQRGEENLAAQHLARSIELDPTIPGARHQQGLLHFQAGAWQDAAAEFRAARELDPGHAFGDTLLYEGRCAFRLGDLGNAVLLLRTHERQHGGSRRSHVWLAEALQASGDRAAATAALRYAASAPGKQRLTAEENWFRARARTALWGRRGEK